MADETKIMYCCDRPQQDNSAMWASLMNNSGWNNNPFFYLIFLMMFRNGAWGNEGENFNSRQISALQDTVNSNHNNTIAIEAIKGNATAIGQLAQTLSSDFNTVSTAICSVKSAIERVSGEVGFSAERVINAINLGDANLMSKMQDCCCQQKQLILEQGYQSQLATERQTCILGSKLDGNFASLQLQNCKDNGAVLSRIDQLANGITQGFSASAYESARLARDTQDVMKYESQRQIDAMHAGFKSIEDKMCQSEINSLRAQIEEKDRRLMVQEIIAQVKAGCGCGC